MSAADLEALFALWRAGDEVGSAAYFAPEGVYQEAGKAPVVGRDAIAAHWAPFFHGGPPWKLTVEEIVGDGNRFVVVYTWEMQSRDGSSKTLPGCALVHAGAAGIERWREYHG